MNLESQVDLLKQCDHLLMTSSSPKLKEILSTCQVLLNRNIFLIKEITALQANNEKPSKENVEKSSKYIRELNINLHQISRLYGDLDRPNASRLST